MDKEAIRFILKVLSKPGRIRLIRYLHEKGECSGAELVDEGSMHGAFSSEFIYYNLINKRLDEKGKKHYSLSKEGHEITEAFENLIDKIHLIIEELD